MMAIPAQWDEESSSAPRPIGARCPPPPLYKTILKIWRNLAVFPSISALNATKSGEIWPFFPLNFSRKRDKIWPFFPSISTAGQWAVLDAGRLRRRRFSLLA